MVHIGVLLYPADPFWVQVGEGIEQRARELNIQLTSLHGYSDPTAVIDTILALGIDGIICFFETDHTLATLVGAGIPVVYLNETELRHPLLMVERGIYEGAQIAGRYLVEQLGGCGRLLVAGNMETTYRRVEGVRDLLASYPAIELSVVSCNWRYDDAYTDLAGALGTGGAPFDAILGLSDSVALAARAAAQEYGRLTERTIVAGINGDPLALAAIAKGELNATVDLGPVQFGIDAVDLINQRCQGHATPAHCAYRLRLVSAENVAEYAMQKLIDTAQIPSRLVGVNRYAERQQLAQLEASLLINRHANSLLDRQQLAELIVNQLAERFGYRHVYLWRYLKPHGVVVRDTPEGEQTPVPLHQSGVLGQAIVQDELILIADQRRSQHVVAELTSPNTITRIVLPIHVGGEIMGLLDLHCQEARFHTHADLLGLQSLADQLGVALRNAELYSEAVKARELAERADQLKTRLLANVSHELRTPLNIILGYTQAMLTLPETYGGTLSPAMHKDLTHVYQSGEHLIRLINDLLDLSRSDIGELELFLETVDPYPLLVDVFHAVRDHSSPGDLEWRLDLPPQLPLVRVDPLRLRQILLNLLTNARKFTERGRIVLGAEVAPPYLHLWVEDTGIGIPDELRERVFDPFVTGDQLHNRREGIGLGLSITRQLVALHHGRVRLESEPERGSIFHIDIPLPSLDGRATAVGDPASTVLLIGQPGDMPAAIEAICRRHPVHVRWLQPCDDIEALLGSIQPFVIAWDSTRARPEDWALVERIQAHPRGRQVPCMLYAQPDESSHSPAGTTNLLLKPFKASSLLEIIEALRPRAASGSILVVDDDPEARTYYRQIITHALAGWRVEAVADGMAALEALARETPSLIVLDLVMPHLDGFGVLAHIRAREETRHVPVLVLSGQLLSEDDVRRLNYAHVLFQSKGILSSAEAEGRLRELAEGLDWLPVQTSVVVKEAIAFMHQEYSRPISRQEIAESVGVSESYLTRIFQQEVGMSPWSYLTRFRVRRACTMLHTTGQSVNEIAEAVGFADPSYFARVFRKLIGCAPLIYRNQPVS